MDTINQRIDFLIKALGFTKTKFAESLHVSSQFVSSLCSGAKQPSDRTIADICREYGVSETWLRTGEGEMKQKLTRNQEIAEFMASIMRDPDDAPRKRFISIVSKLGVEEWQLLEDIAKKWTEDEQPSPAYFLFPRLCDQLPHESPDQIQIRICGQPQQVFDLFQQQIPFHFHKCLHSSTKISSIFCLLLPLRFSSI